MIRFGIFIFFLGSISFAPCTSKPQDIDDFNKIIASSAIGKNIGADIKIKDEKLIREIELKSQGLLESIAPYLTQFLQHGNNIFYKPQILVGTGLNTPFLSHILENKRKQCEEEPLSLNKDKDQEIDKILPENNEENTNAKLPEVPEAPILPPLPLMPHLPKVVVEKPQGFVIKEKAPIEKVIIQEKPSVVQEPPTLLPSKLAIPISRPPPYIPMCISTPNKTGDEISVPCLSSFSSPEYIKFTDFNNIVPKNEYVRPISFPMPRIPLRFEFNKPIKTIMPFRDSVITTTRFLPSISLSKFPLGQLNPIYTYNSDKTFIAKPLKEEENDKLVKEQSPTSSFPAYCAHNIIMGRVLPNIAESSNKIQATPFHAYLI